MRRLLVPVGVLLLAACASSPASRPATPTLPLAETETAFAATMRDRDFEAFARFVAEDAVFLNGGAPLHGKATILEHWRKFFAAPDAPFSWRPEIAETSGSGLLGATEGPVYSRDGKLIARFYSTWRLEKDGHWRIVFDNGYDVCPGREGAS